MERPEERQFAKNPLNEASNRRSEFVAAGLTILRAFILSKPAQTAKILGSYAEWSKLVRAALVWLDEADPCSTMERIRDNDPERAKNLALLSEIKRHFYDDKFYIPDLVLRATEREQAANGAYQFRHPGLHQALADFCGGRDNLSNALIGRAFSKLKDRIFDGMRLNQAKGSGGRSTWQLIGGKDTCPF